MPRVQKYNGKQIITLTRFSEVHNITLIKIKQRFYSHIDKFEEGKDFFKLDCDEFRPYRDKANYNYPRGGYLLTESGYFTICDLLNLQPSLFKKKAATPKVKKSVKETPVEKVNEVEVEVVNEVVKPLPVVEPAVVEPLPVAEKAEEKTEDNATKMELDMVTMFNSFMELQTKQLEVFQNQMSELTSLVKEIITSPIEPQIMPVTPIPLVSDDTDTLDLPSEFKANTPSDYALWKRNINKAVDKIIALNNPEYSKSSEILHKAYDEIKAQYGVCWDQEKKEFFNENGRGPINTLELAWYIEGKNPSNANLLLCKLSTIYGKARRTA